MRPITQKQEMCLGKEFSYVEKYIESTCIKSNHEAETHYL